MRRSNFYNYATITEGQKYPKVGFIRKSKLDVPEGCKEVLIYTIPLRKEDVRKYGLVDLNPEIKNLGIMRMSRGLRQKDLAELTGLSLRTIQGWEIDGIAVANLGKAYRVAKVLECTLEELLDEEDLAWKPETHD